MAQTRARARSYDRVLCASVCFFAFSFAFAFGRKYNNIVQTTRRRSVVVGVRGRKVNDTFVVRKYSNTRTPCDDDDTVYASGATATCLSRRFDFVVPIKFIFSFFFFVPIYVYVFPSDRHTTYVINYNTLPTLLVLHYVLPRARVSDTCAALQRFLVIFLLFICYNYFIVIYTAAAVLLFSFMKSPHTQL